jgi:hypothetical protein
VHLFWYYVERERGVAVPLLIQEFHQTGELLVILLDENMHIPEQGISKEKSSISSINA